MTMYVFHKEVAKEGNKIKKKFKCPDCTARYTKLGLLHAHVLREHEDLIPDGVTVKQYLFNRRNKKTHGICTICRKNPTDWNEDKGRYDLYCSQVCKEESRKRFQKNMKRVHGTDNLAKDPEFQKKMMAGRSISGTYKFSDGKEIPFVGSYEEDFLKFLDEDMDFKSTEILEAPIAISYKDEEGKERFYIPDYYIPSVNLLIEVKDGGDNPNNHPKIQAVDKVREKLKDQAVIDMNQYNYVKVVDKDYTPFIQTFNLLKDMNLSVKGDDTLIVHIPE